MRRWLLAAAIGTAAVLAPAAHAQDSTGTGLGVGSAPPAPAAPTLLDDIELTTSQQDSIDAINKRFAKITHELNQENITVRARMTKFLAQRAKRRTDIRAVLTSDQHVQFDKNALLQKQQDSVTANQLIQSVEGTPSTRRAAP